MNDDSQKKDLTRIEDLSDFIHEEEDDLESNWDHEQSQDSFDSSDDDDNDSDSTLSDEPTDPNFTIPDAFYEDDQQQEDQPDFLHSETDQEQFSEDDEFKNDDDSNENFNTDEDFSRSNEYDDHFSEESDFNEEVDTFTEPVEDELPHKQEDSQVKEDEELKTVEVEAANEVTQDIDQDQEPTSSIDSKSSDTEIQSNLSEQSSLNLSLNLDDHRLQENFDDIRESIEKMAYTNNMAEATPPYSVIIENIQTPKQQEQIIDVLIELSIISEDDIESTRKSLELGSFIVPRISEYVAIMLCHKLRESTLNLMMGLSEEIRSGHHSSSLGSTTQKSLKQNSSDNFDLTSQYTKVEDIIISTTPYLENYHIDSYLGVAAEQVIIDMDDYDSILEDEILDQSSQKLLEQKIIEQNYQSISSHQSFEFSDDTQKQKNKDSRSLKQIYDSLIERLRPSAVKLHGNAIIGINFQISPISQGVSAQSSSKYQINCTGSVVWAIKK